MRVTNENIGEIEEFLNYAAASGNEMIDLFDSQPLPDRQEGSSAAASRGTTEEVSYKLIIAVATSLIQCG